MLINDQITEKLKKGQRKWAKSKMERKEEEVKIISPLHHYQEF